MAQLSDVDPADPSGASDVGAREREPRPALVLGDGASGQSRPPRRFPGGAVDLGSGASARHPSGDPAESFRGASCVQQRVAAGALPGYPVAVVLARDTDPADLRRMRADGTLLPVRRGAYVAAADVAGAARDERRMAATILAVHGHVSGAFCFSHESAAYLWGCPLWPTPTQVHITHEQRPKSRGDRDLVRHHGLPPVDERTRVRGLPVTTLERTVVDCASSMMPDRSLVVADAALRLGADRQRIAQLLSRRAGHRGVRRARLVVGLADPGAESPGESLTRWALLGAGFDALATQVEVTTRLGTFRLDLAVVALRVGIEFDGFVKYSGALGSTAPQAVFAEKRRQDALDEAGWTIVRVTWADLRDPDELARRVRRAFRRASDRVWRPG